MRRWIFNIGLVCLLLGAWGIAACSRGGEAPSGLKVVVTVAPLKGLVEPLLPAGSTITVLMQPGKSEHGYEFTPADIAAVTKADVVVYVGLGLDAKIESALKTRGSASRQAVGFAESVHIKRPAAGADEHEESGHDEHAHHHGSVDPHLWLDPVLVDEFLPSLSTAIQAAANQKLGGNDAGGAIDSSGSKGKAALEALRERVKLVDKEWRERLAPLKGRSVVTHHNAFSRPAERYGFRVAAVIREFETSEPSPGDLAKVVEAVGQEHVRTIFIEPQFSGAAAERIAARAGVKVGRLDPLGDGDWFMMMRSNLEALVNGLSDGAPPDEEKGSERVTPGGK